MGTRWAISAVVLATVAVAGASGLVRRGCSRGGPPEMRVLLSDAVEIAAGDYHACATTRDGRVFCWGDNRFGALGDGTTEPRSGPVLVVGLQAPIELSLGNHASCARLDGGELRCWGRNDLGQLGDGTRTGRPSPVPIRGIPAVTEVTRGVLHACARSEDGAVFCWGDNSMGQLGDGIQGSRLVPTAVPDVGGVTQIVAGPYHTCALVGRWGVRCWGRGGGFSAGPHAAAGTYEPAFEGAESLLPGGFCARWPDYRFRCEGGGTPEGDGVASLPFGPELRLFDGRGRNCALPGTGEVLCWGMGDWNRLGYEPPETCYDDGDQRPCSTRPRPVPGLEPVEDLALTANWSCARERSGLVRCWGFD